MSKHTPGPWIGTVNGWIKTEQGAVIAQTFDNPDTGMEELGEEPSEYNTKMIRAVPDLVKSMEDAINALSSMYSNPSRYIDLQIRVREDLKKALAEATSYELKDDYEPNQT